jgi:selenocysteine-specific elongation factor
MRDRLSEIYSTAGLEVPKLDEALATAGADTGLDTRAARKVFQLLVNNGQLVAVTNEYYFTTESLDRLIAKVRSRAQSSGDPTLDVARFKEIAGVSRKYAIPLLEYFDRTRVTQRIGDKRRIL